MIGGSASRSSDTTDDHTASDPVGANDPIPHSSVAIFGDDAFEKINMDFDLSGESSKPRSSDTSVASDMLFEKLYNSELGGASELKGMIGIGNSPEDNSKIGISSKLGDIGDELNMDLLEDNLFPNGDYGDNNGGNDYSLPSNPLHALISNDSSLRSLNHQAQEVTENSESSADQMLKLLPETGNGDSEASIENMLMENGDNSLEHLINAPLIDMDRSFPDSSGGNNEAFGSNNNDNDNDNRNSNTNNNRSFGLEHVGSSGSLSDSIGSLQTLGLDNRNSNEPFPVHTSSGSMNSVRLNSQVMNNSMNNSINISNNSRSTSAAVAQQQKQQMAARQQQQQALLMQRQQQLFLQQQQQMRQQQQQQLNNNSKKSAAASSIQSIVNDQLSQLPQVGQLTKLGVVGLEEEKMKLIRRLQQIEHSNMPLNTGQQQQRQQQQQQQQQQFLLQQQVLLKQQQLQLEQQKKQQLQQQQGASMPSLGTGGQITQGQMELQGQQQQQQQSNMGFAINQQIMQQQQQGGIAQGLLSPRPIAAPPTQTSFFNNNSNSNNMMNISNNSNNIPGGKSSLQQQQTSMFSNTSGVSNDNNNNKMKANVSSVMGSQGKETPLLSFLRKNRGSSNNNNTMSAQIGQQQQPTSQAAAASLNTTNHSISSEGSLFDGTPIDYNASSSNPFLRQMMNNLDRSVNRNSSMRGQIGGLAGSGLSNLTRRNMMQQMSTTGQISKSCRELEKQISTDSYESAGIIARHGSMDQIPTRRNGLTAGAAKAQNRRFTLNRSNNSFGNLNKSNLNKSRSGPRRELKQAGSGSSSRSLPGKFNTSKTSLTSEDSSGSLITIKVGGKMGRRSSKHKLGVGNTLAHRTSSVPYMNSFATAGESAASIQQRREGNQQGGGGHNHQWS